MSNWLSKCLLLWKLHIDWTHTSHTQFIPHSTHTLTQHTPSLNTHPHTPRGAPSDHSRSPQSHDLCAGREDGGVAVYGLYPDSTPLYSSSVPLRPADELANLGGWGGGVEKKKREDVLVERFYLYQSKLHHKGLGSTPSLLNSYFPMSTSAHCACTLPSLSPSLPPHVVSTCTVWAWTAVTE